MSKGNDLLNKDLDENKGKRYNISIEKKNTKANIRLGTKIVIYLIISGISGAFFSNLIIQTRYNRVIQQINKGILNNEMIISDYTQIVDIVAPSIVSISENEENLLSEGSRKDSWTGVIIGKTGDILTNYSAVKDLSEVFVRVNSEEVTTLPAKVLVKNLESDLAIVKVDYEGELVPIKFASEDSLEIGQQIVIIGSGVYGEFVSSAVPGIITSKYKGVGINGTNISLIQVDATINHGNTGGPICNSKGELVGLASLQLTEKNYEYGLYQGVELGELQDIINSTNAFKEILGVYDGGILSDKTKEFKGFYVQEVVKGGNAYNAGIKPTDIIFEIDENKVLSIEKLALLIENKKIGDIVSCKVLSDGVVKEIDIKIIN